jgi:hypothetical protein
MIPRRGLALLVLALGAVVEIVAPSPARGADPGLFEWRNPSLAEVAKRAKSSRRPAAVHVVTEH